MQQIYNDFVNIQGNLEDYSEMIAKQLRKQDKVHTVRSRIKDPEHLIAKLIRKTPVRKENKGEDFEFTVENYKEEITDLVGLRVIHIFKEDWIDIHDYINKNWKITESQVNVRVGDQTDYYTEQGVQINPRETGYRSVHYLIEFNPNLSAKVIVEIQVRTIFEEGYGEVDHQLNYPNSNVPQVLSLNLLQLNRLAGSADEMASAVKIIKKEWSLMQHSLEEKERELENLKTKIEKLDIEKEDKDSLVDDISKIKETKYNYFYSPEYTTSLAKSLASIHELDPDFLQKNIHYITGSTGSTGSTILSKFIGTSKIKNNDSNSNFKK